jgi:tRNA(Ile)-lysidine synthetase-like protein
MSAAQLDAALADLVSTPGLLPPPGAAALIATSAGLDSMVLARLLVPLLGARGHRCVLAWLDHGWRPADAAREQRFVEDLAASLGISAVTSCRTPIEARERAVGAEAAAREQRLQWLAEAAASEGAERIYLGHHRDDQIETILLRRREGVPVARAASMQTRNGLFIRPLLPIPKAALEKMAVANGWPWLEDPSNQDRARRRNELRHLVIPARSADDPLWPDAVLAAGRRARSRLDRLQRQVDEALPQLLHGGEADEGVLLVSRGHLHDLGEDAAILALQRLCSPNLACDRPPGRRALQLLIAALPRGGRSRLFHLGAGWTALLSGEWLHLRRGQDIALEAALAGLQASLREGRPLSWPEHGELSCCQVTAEHARQLLDREEGAGRRFAVFDLEALELPLHVRSAGIGLTIRPFGMSGSRKLRDVLAEAKVARYDRANWPVVMDALGRVLWLPGIRASAHAALLPHSTAAALLYTTASLPLECVPGLRRNRVS